MSSNVKIGLLLMTPAAALLSWLLWYVASGTLSHWMLHGEVFTSIRNVNCPVGSGYGWHGGIFAAYATAVVAVCVSACIGIYLVGEAPDTELDTSEYWANRLAHVKCFPHTLRNNTPDPKETACEKLTHAVDEKWLGLVSVQPTEYGFVLQATHELEQSTDAPDPKVYR